MKKTIALLLLLAMAISLFACGTDAPSPDGGTSSSDVPTDGAEKPIKPTEGVNDDPYERPTKRPASKPGSATEAPTVAPTAAPTVAPWQPTEEPTEPEWITPTIPPSDVPSEPEWITPTVLPTASETEAPTEGETEPPLVSSGEYDPATGLYFDRYGDFYYTVSDYSDEYAFVAIPASFNGLPVVRIQYDAFAYCENLTSVTVPASVTVIEESAFYCCQNLALVMPEEGHPVFEWVGDTLIDRTEKVLLYGLSTAQIPNDGSVERIGGYAFSYCMGLTSLVLPDSLKAIGCGAFDGCENLASVVIPEGLELIDDYAFNNCYALTSVSLPEGLLRSGESAFEYTGISSITLPSALQEIGWGAFGYTQISSCLIPASVKKIEGAVFRGCNELTSLTVDSGNAQYMSVDNCLIDRTNGALVAACITSVLPTDGTLLRIGESAFTDMDMLESIVIPEGVTHIDADAFYACSNLQSVTLPETLIYIDSYAFALTALQSIVFPDTLTGIAGYAFNNTLLESLHIPASVTYIEASTFAFCSELSSITVDSANPVYMSAFNCLIDKTDLILMVGSQDGRMPTDGSIWYIGDDAFAGKGEITAVTVPEDVRGIGVNAFLNCGALQTVTLPSSLTYIGANAFEYCYAIETVIFGGTEDQWYDLSIGDWNDYLLNATIYVDGGDTLLKEASGEEGGIEAPAEGMDEYGFCYERVGDEYALVAYTGTETQLILPDSFSGLPIQSIAMGAFQDNTALEGILIPASVRFIVAEAFQGCTSLSVLQFAEESELATIGSDAFQNCDSLVSVTLPEGLLTIGARAFNSCDRLEEISLPTTLESIGTAAFAYSPKLGSVVLHEGLITLGEDAFAGCEGLVSVSLPEGLTEIGGGAFAGCVLLESITIPASVTMLGDWMFQSCRSLVSLAVEDGNEHYAGVGNCIIAKESGTLLYGCQNSQIPMDGSVTSINWYAFFECTALESITIPEGVTFIDLYAFEKCTNLRTVYLPSTLTGIATEAFDECENLETVYYNGSQDEFEAKVSIGEYNGDLTGATFVFAK